MFRYFLVLTFFAILFMPQIFAEEQSYTYDYYAGSLRFDTVLDGVSCDFIQPNPIVGNARSLDIDGMDDYFFIVLGKTNSGDYHYLQIPLPDNKGKEHLESYLLDFKMKNKTSVGGGLYQDYTQLAIYKETGSKAQPIDDASYKKFFVGKSLNVVPSSYSIGPGDYDMHVILFQSDRSNWLKDEVCAISLNWPVSVDSSGNITVENPQTQVGRIYPLKTDQKALAETEEIIEQANQKKTTLENNTDPLKAIVQLDKKTYTWTDIVYITVSAPSYNVNSNTIDEIGQNTKGMVTIKTSNHQLNNYKLVETGVDTGIFTGTVTLTGFLHNADGNKNTGDKNGNDAGLLGSGGDGPDDGLLPAGADDRITVTFEFSEDEAFVGSSFIKWNAGQVQWLKNEYDATGTGMIRITDPDMNFDPKSIDRFVVDVWSDSDSGGIDLTVTETNEATGIFEGTVRFTTVDESYGNMLRVSGEDVVTAEYEDNTLPVPYLISDQLDVIDTSMIKKIPPLSPYEQLTMGVITSDIVCDDGFEQIFKPTGFVVCVTPLSAEKLVQRGWSMDSIPVDFTGEWKNKNSRTSGIANLVITQADSTVTIHAWASDRPDFEDWGTAAGTVNGNSVMLTWNLESITHELVIKKIGDELQVERKSASELYPMYVHATEYFVPGTLVPE